VLEVLRGVDVLYGNLETTVFDVRNFAGAPYSWDGDWTNSSEPAVARDLKAMGFGIVSRANNHALDWGLEGMRETSRHLDEAGIVYAGVGEERGLARAPRYLETAKARVALVSIASSFRPTTDALPRHGAAPGRPGLSALHLTRTIVLPEAAMHALAQTECAVYRRHCGETPAELELFEMKFRRGSAFAYDYAMDPEDLAEIERNIRSARQNADLVIVSIHSHECTAGCDDPSRPRGAGNFLRRLAHEAIDSGADLFVTTGNHNLGAIELYRSPLDFTFRSVIAVARFSGDQMAELRLYPIEDGYGDRLPKSGIPRRVTDQKICAAIFGQIEDATREYGLPRLEWDIAEGVATLREPVTAR